MRKLTSWGCICRERTPSRSTGPGRPAWSRPTAPSPSTCFPAPSAGSWRPLAPDHSWLRRVTRPVEPHLLFRQCSAFTKFCACGKKPDANIRIVVWVINFCYLYNTDAIIYWNHVSWDMLYEPLWVPGSFPLHFPQCKYHGPFWSLDMHNTASVSSLLSATHFLTCLCRLWEGEIPS